VPHASMYKRDTRLLLSRPRDRVGECSAPGGPEPLQQKPVHRGTSSRCCPSSRVCRESSQPSCHASRHPSWTSGSCQCGNEIPEPWPPLAWSRCRCSCRCSSRTSSSSRVQWMQSAGHEAMASSGVDHVATLLYYPCRAPVLLHDNRLSTHDSHAHGLNWATSVGVGRPLGSTRGRHFLLWSLSPRHRWQADEPCLARRVHGIVQPLSCWAAHPGTSGLREDTRAAIGRHRQIESGY